MRGEAGVAASTASTLSAGRERDGQGKRDWSEALHKEIVRVASTGGECAAVSLFATFPQGIADNRSQAEEARLCGPLLLWKEGWISGVRLRWGDHLR